MNSQLCNHSPLSQRARQGFTLVEVMMAVAIVSVGALTLIAALGQTATFSGEIRARDEAQRTESVIRDHFKSLTFEEAYEIVAKGDQANFAYFYKGDDENRREDDDSPTPNADGDLNGIFREVDDPFLNQDLLFTDGTVFRVRLTSFDPETNDEEPLSGDADSYDEFSINVFVELFEDPAPTQNQETWVETRRILSFPLMISR